jgi:hypothetical protein
MFLLPGQPVFKAVQFHGQPGRSTIEVKKVSAERMLAAELKSRKATGSQPLPELRLCACLLAAQPPGIAGRIHRVERTRPFIKDKSCRRVSNPARQVSKRASSPRPSSPKEERENASPWAHLSTPVTRCWVFPSPRLRGEGQGEGFVHWRTPGFGSVGSVGLLSPTLFSKGGEGERLALGAS